MCCCKLVSAILGALLCATNIVFAQNPIVLGNKRITVITPTLLRLEYSQNQKFLDLPTLFARERGNILKNGIGVTALDGGKQYEIKTDCFRLLVDNDNLPFGQINTWIFFKHNGKEKKITGRNLHSKTQNFNLGGSISTLDGVSKEIPTNDGILSSDGWYYIVDTGTDVLKDDWLATRDRDHVQDQYCFVYGDDFHAPFRDLGVISGKVSMTRKYQHGIWYSRWYPYDSDYINELINGYNEQDFPVDVLSVDMDWHTLEEATVGIGHNFTKGWTGFTWNRKLILDPKALIKGLLRDSIYTTLNEHPHDGIRPHEECYEAFMRAMGKDPATEESLLFDCGDRKYMENYLKYTREENRDLGVAFWWVDWQQDYLYPMVLGTMTPTLKWINKLFYEDTEKDNLRGAGYSRWGGWGDHRHPINFSGDARGNWDVLKFEVKLSATSGNQGCYYWAHDIGGFHGGTVPELLVRWSQFGALSAALRVHAARGADLDRRPWLWGDTITTALRTAYHFRSEMMPYIYSSIRTTHETMLPLNRCMFVDYSTNKNAYNRYGQFMFGDIVLAAPITKNGEGPFMKASQEVWFPEGDDWYDFFTDEKHVGGEIKDIEKDIYSFPVFVKGGYVLPMQPYNRRPASSDLKTLVMRVYPGKDGDVNTFTLYEDDGVSRDYEMGEYAKTTLTYIQKGKKVSVIVNPTQGSYKEQLPERAYRLEICGFGSERRYIDIPSRSIRNKTIINFML